MVNNLQVKNFRSLVNADIDLAGFTIITGKNNSGKSSLIYSLLCLKNILSNPNQTIDGCLTLPFINLGGFNQAIFNKQSEHNIEISFRTKKEDQDNEVDYTVSIGKTVSYLKLKSRHPIPIDCKIEIAFPYPFNKNEKFEFSHNDIELSFEWNGLQLSNINISKGGFLDVNDTDQADEIERVKSGLINTFISPFSAISQINHVPIRRGFTKPYYAMVPLSNDATTEDEIASLLASDRELVSKVSFYLEKIVGRSFSVHTTPNTSIFYLQTLDKLTGMSTDIVNEGLGTNQLITILAKVLSTKNRIICIDEPEIHLHPSVISKLVDVLIEIRETEDMQFLLSTHSEHLIGAMLSSVAERKLSQEDINVLYLDKDAKKTAIEIQKVNADGQIEGGLSHFISHEIESTSKIFKIN